MTWEGRTLDFSEQVKPCHYSGVEYELRGIHHRHSWLVEGKVVVFSKKTSNPDLQEEIKLAFAACEASCHPPLCLWFLAKSNIIFYFHITFNLLRCKTISLKNFFVLFFFSSPNCAPTFCFYSKMPACSTGNSEVTESFKVLMSWSPPLTFLGVSCVVVLDVLFLCLSPIALDIVTSCSKPFWGKSPKSFFKQRVPYGQSHLDFCPKLEPHWNLEPRSDLAITQLPCVHKQEVQVK